jgi:hypothetical protein
LFECFTYRAGYQFPAGLLTSPRIPLGVSGSKRKAGLM